MTLELIPSEFLNFLIYEENLVYFFISANSLPHKYRADTAENCGKGHWKSFSKAFQSY